MLSDPDTIIRCSMCSESSTTLIEVSRMVFNDNSVYMRIRDASSESALSTNSWRYEWNELYKKCLWSFSKALETLVEVCKTNSTYIPRAYRSGNTTILFSGELKQCGDCLMESTHFIQNESEGLSWIIAMSDDSTNQVICLCQTSKRAGLGCRWWCYV